MFFSSLINMVACSLQLTVLTLGQWLYISLDLKIAYYSCVICYVELRWKLTVCFSMSPGCWESSGSEPNTRGMSLSLSRNRSLTLQVRVYWHVWIIIHVTICVFLGVFLKLELMFFISTSMWWPQTWIFNDGLYIGLSYVKKHCCHLGKNNYELFFAKRATKWIRLFPKFQKQLWRENVKRRVMFMLNIQRRPLRTPLQHLSLS